MPQSDPGAQGGRAQRALSPPFGRFGARACAHRAGCGAARAGVELWRRIGGAAAHGGGDAPGDAGDLHRHRDALCRDAGLSAGAGRAARPARSARHPPRCGGARAHRPRTDAIPTRYRRLLCPAQDRPCSARSRGSTAGSRGASAIRRARAPALEFFEVEDATGRLKVNPLAHWARDDLRTYMEENRLPRHPLVARGYPSIGCWPCTTPVREMKIPAQAAGVTRKKPNAASMSRAAASSAREFAHDHHRHRPGLRPR